jgi:hypothetical protein
MSYTGHKNRKMPDGKTVVEWSREGIRNECLFFGVPMPTDEQIAVVISQMRMHHLMMHAADYDYSELGKPDEVTKFWPMQSSIGRFLRDSAAVTLDAWRMNEDKRKKYFHNHVCATCSPDGIHGGAGCINCRNTGYDQTPCVDCPGGTE